MPPSKPASSREDRVGASEARAGRGAGPAPRELSAHLGFFPAALACGLLTVPAWAALAASRPDLASWHGHEMLFGYGLAVVAGFLLARIRRDLLAVLLGFWLLARIAAPIGAPVLAAAAALAFAGLLSAVGAMRFLRAAKKGRNRMFAVILLGAGAAEAVYQAGALGLLESGETHGLFLMLDLLTLLMLQMGGRVIPAATAGALQHKGVHLADRVQPRIETAISAAMLAMTLFDQIDGFEFPAAIAALGAAALAALRLARWRPWTILALPDLVGLHLAYGWLFLGLALKAASALTDRIPPMAGIHALGIGGMGTLTLVMMARTAAMRAGSRPTVPPSIALVALLTSAAACLRIAAAFSDGAPALLWCAAGIWTLALVLFAAISVSILCAPRP